jgi:hypothetical protein
VKLLGAVSTSDPFSLLSTSGFIQELYCCDGRLFSNVLKHESQKEMSCIVYVMDTDDSTAKNFLHSTCLAKTYPQAKKQIRLDTYGLRLCNSALYDLPRNKT